MIERGMRGFTLIEFIITVAVMMVLLLEGVPLAMGWIGSSNVQTGKTLLLQGSAWAKSRALRNANQITDGSPTAFLVLKNGTVCALDSHATSADCASGSSLLWTGSMPNATTATLNGQALQCVAYSSAGVPMSFALGGTTCMVGSAYTVSSMGGQNASGIVQ